MMHKNRKWCVAPIESAKELARKLTETTWCCCTAFELAGYLWLNDSTSADGAEEYAVLKKADGNGRPVQIESITFGWCSPERALEHIQRTLRGEDDGNDFAREVSPTLESAEAHGRCHHCA